MEVKMKAKEVTENLQNLTALVAERKKFPGQLMLAVTRSIKILRSEGETIQESNEALIKEFSAIDENGLPKKEDFKMEVNGTVETLQKAVFKDKKAEIEYGERYKELMNSTLDLTLPRIAWDAIEECQESEESRLDTIDMLRLDFLIECQE